MSENNRDPDPTDLDTGPRRGSAGHPWVLARALLLASSIAGGCESVRMDGCEELHFSPCDIDEHACLQRESDYIACLRGDEGAHPPTFEVLSEFDYDERYGYDGEDVGGGSSEETNACLELLGLAGERTQGPGCGGCGLGGGRPDAFYDAKLGRVIVVERTQQAYSPFEDVERTQMASLHRAIATAFLDRDTRYIADLEAASSYDESFAIASRAFGELLFITDAAIAKDQPLEEDEFQQFILDNVDYDEERSELLLASRNPAVRLDKLHSYAPYLGADLVRSAWSSAGIFETAPEDFSRLGDIILRQTTPPLDVGFPDLVDPWEGYEYAWSDALGALTLHAFLTRANPAVSTTPLSEDLRHLEDAAAALRGDRMTCAYDSVHGNAYVVWELDLEPTVDLDTVITNAPEGVVWLRKEVGSRLILVGSDETLIAGKVLDSLS